MSARFQRMTAKEAVDKASSQIQRRDAETLLCHRAGQGRAWLLAHPEARMEAGQEAAFFEDVARRAERWPLQYLTGRQEFFGLELRLSRDVLIPRPETELLVSAVLAWADKGQELAEESRTLQIVDVGTGSGAIALALANQLARAVVWALDVSSLVGPVVKDNAQRLGLTDRVRFEVSNLLSACAGQIEDGWRPDIVVSNPPYVAVADACTLQPEVRDHEPHLALFAGDDGLAVYRRLIPQAWEALRPGGLLAMEFGYGQQAALAELLQAWDAVQFQEDYVGIPRVVLAERPLG